MTNRYTIGDFVPLMNRSHPNYEIGEFTYGHPRVMDYGEGVGLKIGKFCSIADEVVFMLGGEHKHSMITTYPFNAFFPFADSQNTHRKFKGNIVVGHDVWIGYGAIILSGVTVGNGAIIGARSVVTRDVASYSIVAGSPAKHLKFRFSAEEIEALNRICWWDWPLPDIEASLPLLLSENIKEFVDRYNV